MTTLNLRFRFEIIREIFMGEMVIKFAAIKDRILSILQRQYHVIRMIMFRYGVELPDMFLMV